MKRAALVFNFARVKNKAWNAQAKMFEKAASEAGFKLDIISTLEALEVIGNYHYDYDFVVMADDDRSLVASFEAMGLPVFNNARSMDIANDKALLYFFLAAYKIPTPRYFASTYGAGCRQEYCYDYFLKAIKKEKMAFPFFVMDRYGEQNAPRDVMMSNNEFSAYVKSRGETPFIAEEYCAGSRLVAYVADGKCVGVLEEKYEKDGFVLFKTPYDTNRFIKREAVLAIEALGEHYGTVYMTVSGKNIALVTGVSFSMRVMTAESVLDRPIASIFFASMLKNYKKKVSLYYTNEELKRFKAFKGAAKELKKRKVVEE